MMQLLYSEALIYIPSLNGGQEAIFKALNFGHDNGLEFGADKTEVVVFTCKRLNTLGLPWLRMANRDLIYSDTVKYLGVLLVAN